MAKDKKIGLIKQTPSPSGVIQSNSGPINEHLFNCPKRNVDSPYKLLAYRNLSVIRNLFLEAK